MSIRSVSRTISLVLAAARRLPPSWHFQLGAASLGLRGSVEIRQQTPSHRGRARSKIYEQAWEDRAMSSPVRVEKRGHVMEVTLDRPKVNAIDLATSRALGEAFQDLQDDPNLR